MGFYPVRRGSLPWRATNNPKAAASIGRSLTDQPSDSSDERAQALHMEEIRLDEDAVLKTVAPEKRWGFKSLFFRQTKMGSWPNGKALLSQSRN